MARILLVDDDNDLRRLVEIILRGLRHNVAACASAFEALEMLKRENYDLLITDFIMPKMNGSELIDAVRQKRPEMPVIMMSGTHADSIQGNFPILKKPLDIVPETMRKAIDKSLND